MEDGRLQGIVTEARKAEYVELCDQSGAKIRVSCGKAMFRVYIDPEGTFTKPASYAVDEADLRLTAPELSKCGDDIILSCGADTLVFHRHAPGFAFGREGEAYFQAFSALWRQNGSFTFGIPLYEHEHILGLGEDNDAFRGTLERRGTCRDMLTGQTITRGCVTADMPVTFYMSSRLYGFYLDNTYHGTFDMGKENPDEAVIDMDGGEMLCYLFAGSGYEEILTSYTDVTGKPSLPPLWTQGYIQSKCTYRDFNDLDELLSRMEKDGFPIDGYVIDADWQEQYVNFKFDPRWGDSIAEKISEYAARGYKLMLSTSGPMIRKDSDLYESGRQAGIFATDGKGNTVTCGWYGGELMDFTSPAMRDWIRPKLKALFDIGVQAWWLDLDEPEGEPVQTQYAVGERARVHNAFPLLNTKVYWELDREFDPNRRPFILGRTSVAGMQKYGASTWTGDIYADCDTFAAHCPEGLNAALSGVPNWTCDTGAFISETIDASLCQHSHYFRNDPAAQALLYQRWFQFSCFTPIARAHHVGPCEPYCHGEAVAASCRRYLKLRYSLLPYIYTYAWRATREGIGVMRALPFYWPDDDRAYACGDEYMFGDAMLAAPVLSEFAQARPVYFPKGEEWIDLDYGYRYTGGETRLVYAPADRIPLFIRAGAIIPMIPDMLHTDEKPWDPISIHLWPRDESRFVMYRDDGRTQAYKNGDCTLTEFTASERDDGLLLCVAEGNDKYIPQRYCWTVHMTHPPKDVPGYTRYSHLHNLTQDGQGWHFDEVHNVLSILAPSPRAGGTLSIDVLTDPRRLYEAPAPKLRADGENLTITEDAKRTARLPYILPPASMPGKMQLENFDRGGEGIAYRMYEKGNAGGLYRSEDVNISLCDDEGGGYALTDIRGGEWLVYTVNVEKAGAYTIGLRVRSPLQSAFHAYFDGRDLTGKVLIPGTGDALWQTVHASGVRLKQGEQALRVFIEEGPVDLNYIELCAEP